MSTHAPQVPRDTVKILNQAGGVAIRGRKSAARQGTKDKSRVEPPFNQRATGI
jgi:hypothetical protein